MKPERWRNLIWMRLRSIVRRRRVEQELNRELRFHLEQEMEANLAAGMAPAEARLAAVRRLGGVEQIKEECRDMRRTAYLESLGQDLRYALRALRKSPGFAAVILLTLALSIGANSAIFSVIDGVLLQPLPYPDQNRIVRIFFTSRTFPKFPLNPFDFRDFRARSRSFEALAAFTRADLQLSGSGQPAKLNAFRITAGYFRALGLAPERGREFDERDELPGNGRLVVLSDRLWRTQFAGTPDIVGRHITLDSQPFTVAGVMPPGAEHPGNDYHPLGFGDTVDAWWPFTFEGNANNRGSHYLEGIGRLKAGVKPEQAQAEMNALLAQIKREHGNQDSDWQLKLIPLYQEIVGTSERLLLVLLGAVGLVLLIACVNAANLLLARAIARQREIAVKSALGAPRSRLIQQMLTESLVIALLGGGLGVVVAVGGVRGLVSLLPVDFPRADSIHVNAAVLAFTVLVAVATGFLFGLVPALQVSRSHLQQGLCEGGRSSTGSGRHTRLRSVLVVAEVSLAYVLLIGAGLMLRSFVNLLRMDPGFRPEHVLTATLPLPAADYQPGEAVSRFYDQLVTRLSTIPGVRSAGAGSDLPWTGYDENTGFDIEGRKAPPNEGFHARYHGATPDYFRALGIPLVHGRFFTEADNKDAPRALIVNEAMARRYWPHQDAVGQRITFSDTPKEADWSKIVGVVGDVKDRPNSSGAEPALWMPELQWGNPNLSIVVRADSDPRQVLAAVRREVSRLDPSLALGDVRLMDQIADAGISAPRFAFFLVGLFAALAMLLAAIGTYGVIAYSVSRRTHEFGLRMALGATPWDVQRLVISQGIRFGLAGVGLGVVAALALARVLRSLIYEVSAVDPLSFTVVSLMVTLVALLACYMPARRATKANPTAALRAE